MEIITVSKLCIGGVEMPAPAAEGVSVSKEKYWSANKGQTASGRTVGTLVAIKTSVTISWPHLTPSQVATIEAAVSNADAPFTTLQFTDLTGQTTTLQVEFSTPSGTWFSWAPGLQYVVDYTVTATER